MNVYQSGNKVDGSTHRRVNTALALGALVIGAAGGISGIKAKWDAYRASSTTGTTTTTGATDTTTTATGTTTTDTSGV